MSIEEQILREIKTIKKILILNNSTFLDDYLSKVISTDIRKKIWMNIDGLKFQKDLVEISGLNQSSVSEFLDKLKIIGLIEYDSKNPPVRMIDYTPSSWFGDSKEKNKGE